MESTQGAALYQPELDSYLAALDRTLPDDAVAGVYLTGSVALGDYRHGLSDLDLLTLTTRPLADAELSALEAMHESLQQGAQPHADAVYVPDTCIGRMPAGDATGHGFVVDGVFHRGTDTQDLVIWAILDQCGVTLRGSDAAGIGAAPDREEFRTWNRGNLESYWQAQAARIRAALAEQPLAAEVPSFAAVWFGSGPGRLHRTITTGEIISKTQSFAYCADLFPVYRELLERAARTRMGDDSIRYTTTDGLALCDLVDEICDSAQKTA
jgi:hypothetical protein